MEMNLSSLSDLRRRLWSATEGLLLVGERVDPVRIAIDPACGQPVMPVHADALRCDDVTLFSPDDNDDSLQVLGTLVELDPGRHPACDRHRMFFGNPERTRWALLEMESVKRLDHILEGAEVAGPSPAHAIEGRLCKRLNARPDLLAEICRYATGTAPASPVAVGVDAFGVSVRARFSIVRLEFGRELTDAEEISGEIDAMIRRVGG